MYPTTSSASTPFFESLQISGGGCVAWIRSGRCQSEQFFSQKFPATTGHFQKDICSRNPLKTSKKSQRASEKISGAWPLCAAPLCLSARRAERCSMLRAARGPSNTIAPTPEAHYTSRSSTRRGILQALRRHQSTHKLL